VQQTMSSDSDSESKSLHTMMSCQLAPCIGNKPDWALKTCTAGAISLPATSRRNCWTGRSLRVLTVSVTGHRDRESL
jgi:hypothetical protein